MKGCTGQGVCGGWGGSGDTKLACLLPVQSVHPTISVPPSAHQSGSLTELDVWSFYWGFIMWA